jgi:hypothetical protein
MRSGLAGCYDLAASLLSTSIPSDTHLFQLIAAMDMDSRRGEASPYAPWLGQMLRHRDPRALAIDSRGCLAPKTCPI